MQALELDAEELSTLSQVLEEEIAELRVEIRHIESSECREMLRHREKIPHKMLSAIHIA